MSRKLNADSTISTVSLNRRGGSNPRDETDEKIRWDVLYELFSLKELEEDG